MRLKHLSLHNFMPYFGDAELPFPGDARRNVVVIYGDNMRGKTSLMNALRWVFYGQAIDRYGEMIPTHLLVNRDAAAHGDWDISVSVKFQSDGKDCELRRVAKKKDVVAVPRRDQDFDFAVSLRDGTDTTHDALAVRRRIGQICPQQTNRFFLFDGELLQEYERLLKDSDDQGAKIKEAIEQILGVPAITNGREQLQTLLKDAQKIQSQEAKQSKALQGAAEEQTRLMEEADRFDKDLKAGVDKLALFKTEAAALKQQIDEGESRFQQKQGEIEKTKHLADLDRDLAVLERRRKTVLKEAWRDLIQPQVNVARKHLLEQIERETELSRRMARTQGRLEEVGKLIKERACPLCEQPVDEDLRNRLAKRAAELEEQVERLQLNENAFFEAQRKLKLLEHLRSSNAAQTYRDTVADLAVKSVQRQKVMNELERVRKDLEGYDTAEMTQIRAKHERRIGDIREVQKLIEKITADKETNRKRREMLAKTLGADQKFRRLRSTMAVELYTSLETVFSKSIDKLRDGLRDKVEGLASKAFRAMTTDKSYKGLRINKNYGLTIIDEHGEEVPIRSAGAEQIVALSLIDGLNSTGRRVGPVIMDTPFGRLDPKHRGNVLRHLPESANQLVLLVHEGELSEKVDLSVIDNRVAARYEIVQVSSRRSRLERRT
jgi:DNA sulfur modification protein DndD